MKKLLILTMIVAGSLVASSANSQVRVDARIGITERNFPGYTYYQYPVWHGHFKDRFYYEHYRKRFNREHKRYFRDGRFDHDRWDNRSSGGRRRH